MRGWGLALAAGCRPDAARVFERDVVPVLEARCSAPACHGVGPGAEARGEVVDRDLLFFDVDGAGHLTDPARARETALRHVVTTEDPVFSTLLRKPLAPAWGGLRHAGGIGFVSPRDDAFRAVAGWIALETGGGEDQAPLEPLEAQFARDVMPFLLGATCASGPCHGAATGVPMVLDAGVDGRLGRAAIRADRELVGTLVSFDGDPTASRLVRKSLPLFDGGIVHKGGNRSFLTGLDDPRLPPVLDWICAERRARTGEDCREALGPPVDGVVYVRGAVGPEDPFDLDVWVPGTDLWLATLGPGPLRTENLTATLHARPADVRDPAVDPTGRWVVFAMRTDPLEGHGLWRLDLRTRDAVRLTAGAGALPGGGFATDRDPTFGPDGLVWFVSTRDGLAADGGRPDAELWTLDPATGATRRRSFTPHVERKPVFFAQGHESAGEVGFTALREVVPSAARGHSFRFPPGLQTEYHQHFGITPPEDLFFDTRELADGRYVTVVSDLRGRWGGRLGIVDRNFGPELGDGPASIPVYAPPLVRLDPDATASDVTGRAWRDPVGLPDGSLLAAVAEGPLALDDPAAAPDFGLVRVVLREASDGSGPQIAAREVLVDEPGVSETDPEPVWVRSPAPLTPTAWDPGADTAVLRHQGFPMVDALLSDLRPSGTRSPREGFVAVRIVEASRPTPDGFADATLGPFLPSRVLAEVPLEEDGTFHVALPAGVAVRLQGLDARGVALGAMHNRWFDLHPGQVVAQGVSPDVYPTTCAVCHGAIDGVPATPLPDLDALTTASLTLARYEGQDPRRPRTPVACDEAAALPSGFREAVRPILDRACVGCHAAGGVEPDLSDTPTDRFDAGYEALWDGGFVDATVGSADLSPLFAKVAGGHGDLDDAERRVVARWLDTGGPWETR